MTMVPFHLFFFFVFASSLPQNKFIQVLIIENHANRSFTTKVMHHFHRIEQKLEKVIRFNRPVKIHFEILERVSRYFDRGNVEPAKLPLAGQTICHEPVVARRMPSEEWAHFPSALVKQLNYDYDEICDMKIWLNLAAAESQLWFPDDNQPIQKHHVDFELLMIHEMMHGFGMYPSWAQVGSDSLIPAIKSNFRFLHSSYPTIFDRYLYGIKNGTFISLTTLAQHIFIYLRNNGINCRADFETCAIKSVAQLAHSLSIVPNKVVFRSERCGQIPLQSFARFEYGNSMVHLNWIYHNTSQGYFSTVKNSIFGVSFEEMEARDKEGTVLGKDILCILTEMGWPTILNDFTQAPLEIKKDHKSIHFYRGNDSTHPFEPSRYLAEEESGEVSVANSAADDLTESMKSAVAVSPRYEWWLTVDFQEKVFLGALVMILFWGFLLAGSSYGL